MGPVARLKAEPVSYVFSLVMSSHTFNAVVGALKRIHAHTVAKSGFIATSEPFNNVALAALT